MVESDNEINVSKTHLMEGMAAKDNFFQTLESFMELIVSVYDIFVSESNLLQEFG